MPLPQSKSMRIVSGIALLFVLCVLAVAQKPKSCGGVDSLVGEWTGVGSGAPGEGGGGFTFQRELQGKVLVRRSFAEYPPANGRPAYRHDDLMVIYGDANARRADYWDNENHVIRYAVATSADGCALTFESEQHPMQPRYRLTYKITSPDEVSIGFQVAAPGKDFGDYITATAKRKK